MGAAAVPFKLRERLGSEATGGLLHVLGLTQREWREDVLSLSVERFERRLAEKSSALRVQVAQSEAALRGDIGQLEGRLRHEMDQAESRMRQEMGQVEGRLRHEVGQLEVRLRGELGHVDGALRQDLSQLELRIIREIGNSRFDLLKRTFAFLIGQVVAMSAIMAAMLRIVR